MIIHQGLIRESQRFDTNNAVGTICSTSIDNGSGSVRIANDVIVHSIAREYCDVFACTTIDNIVTTSAGQCVISIFTEQGVVAASADQSIITMAGPYSVIASTTIDDIHSDAIRKLAIVEYIVAVAQFGV